MNDLATQVQDNAIAHDAEIGNLIQDMKAGHIDPNAYINKMSSGQKMSTAIGLILGGIGGGIDRTGQNPALDFLNNQIKNDINAQVENRNNKNTIFNAMEKQFGNKQDALKMTEAFYLSKTANEINTAAAKSGNALAMSRAQQVTGQLLDKKNILIKQTAQEQALHTMMAGGDADSAIGMMPESVRERYVPGYGLALNKEAAMKANEKVGGAQNAISGINELKAMVGKSSNFSLQDRAKAQTLASYLKGALRTEIVGPGAVSEREWKLLDSIIADPTAITKLDSSSLVRLNTLSDRIQTGMNMAVKQYGLKPKPMQATFNKR